MTIVITCAQDKRNHRVSSQRHQFSFACWKNLELLDMRSPHSKCFRSCLFILSNYHFLTRQDSWLYRARFKSFNVAQFITETYYRSCCKVNNCPLDSTCSWGRVAQSVGHLTRKSGVLGSIPGLATYFRFSFRFFKKGSCQLLAKVCARSTG